MAKISELKLYSGNPFLEGIDKKLQPRRKVIGRGRHDEIGSFDNKTGEVYASASFQISKVTYVDSESFIKIYKHSLKDIFTLSKSASTVLFYIMSIIEKKADTFVLNIADCVKSCGYTGKSAVYAGVVELADKGIIARRSKDTYYANPKVFFNGDRMDIIDSYIKVKKEDELTVLAGQCTRTEKYLEGGKI